MIRYSIVVLTEPNEDDFGTALRTNLDDGTTEEVGYVGEFICHKVNRKCTEPGNKYFAVEIDQVAYYGLTLEEIAKKSGNDDVTKPAVSLKGQKLEA